MQWECVILRPTASSSSLPPTDPGGGFWASIRLYPTFRLLWFSALAASVSQWMQAVALGWLALTMTDSPGFVGIVSFMAGAPFLIVAPLGGSLIDRLDRRKLMLACQALAFALSLIVAVDVIGGWARPWHLIVFGVLNGSLQALINPTQQSLVPTLVDREHLTNAIGLMSAGQNMTRVLGPSLAGLVIGLVGTGETFLLQAVALAAAFLMVLRISLPERAPHASGNRNPLEGLQLIATREDLRGIFLLASIPTLLVFPYISFLNVFARDVLGIGAQGLGVLMAASGLGAVAGSLTVAGKGRSEGMGRWLLFGTIAYCLVIMGLTFTRSLWLALPLLFVAGFLGAAFMVGNNAAIQLRIDDRVRGRVMGAYMLTWGMMPLGALPMGIVAQQIGMPASVFIFAAAATVLTVLLSITNRTLRDL
jgi:predicted MFS family arabinose efflux permease